MYGETTKTSPRSFFAVVIVIVGLVCFIIFLERHIAVLCKVIMITSV